jgi:CheY-like chemotaxis protein
MLVQALNFNHKNYKLEAKSKLGRGSIFSFPLTVKLDELSEKVINLRENPFIFKTQNLRNLNSIQDYSNLKTENIPTNIQDFDYTAKLLIVDDDQMNLLVAKSYLNSVQEGIFYYETANNGLEALEVIKTNSKKKIFFDIILMDCNMPVMDGFQASTLIKTMEKKREIPYVTIIAITANVAFVDKSKCLKHGMELFIAKPYKKSQLMMMIKKALCFKNHNKDKKYLCN